MITKLTIQNVNDYEYFILSFIDENDEIVSKITCEDFDYDDAQGSVVFEENDKITGFFKLDIKVYVDGMLNETAHKEF